MCTTKHGCPPPLKPYAGGGHERSRFANKKLSLERQLDHWHNYDITLKLSRPRWNKGVNKGLHRSVVPQEVAQHLHMQDLAYLHEMQHHQVELRLCGNPLFHI